MNDSPGQTTLKGGLPMGELYTPEALVRLDALFLQYLEGSSPELHHRLTMARKDPSALADKPRSELIIELAPHLEDFLGLEFGISRELAELQARHNEAAPLYAIKRKFVQRKALTGV